MNKFDFIAKEEKEEKEKLEQGNLATYIKFDYYNFNKDADAETYMMISLTAPEMKIKDKRTPLNISACLDVSGSMGDRAGKSTKIDYLKNSMEKMIQHLTDDDVLGIVTFTTAISEEFKPAKMTAENKEKAIKIVKGLRPLNGTNLSGGLFKSIEQINVNKGKEFINRVILFTDGEANEGIVDTNQLNVLMKEHLGMISSTSCFGFGETYNQELLELLSKDGRGNLYHIKQAEDVSTSFAKELGGLLSVFAQNLEVELKLEKGVELIEKYNADLIEGPGNLKFRINDIYSQETRNLLFKLKVPKCDGMKNICKASISYLDLIKNKKVENEKTAKIKFVEQKDADATKDIDKEVAMQISIAEAAKAQTQADIYARAGDYQNAKLVLANAAITVSGYSGNVDNSAIMHDLTNVGGLYANATSYQANLRSLSAVRMSYTSGRSAETVADYATANNAITEDLLKSFKEDEDKKS